MAVAANSAERKVIFILTCALVLDVRLTGFAERWILKTGESWAE